MPFEDDLGKLLNNTAGTFTADRKALAEGSLVRGRRRLARRRAAAVAASALAVVLATTTGVQLGDGQHRDGEKEDPATRHSERDYGHFAVSAEDMRHILQNGMNASGSAGIRPKLKATGSSRASRPATATIDFGDGFGAARVTLSVRRVDPAQAGLKTLITCPPKDESPFDECTTQPDNRAVKGYTETGKTGGIKKWAVTMLSSNGYVIEVANYNVAAAKAPAGEPVTRNPRMSLSKLRNLAAFVDGSFTPAGEPDPLGTSVPGSRAEPSDILPVLKSLLPQRLHIYSEGAAGGEGHVVVVDGKTGQRTYIQAVRVAGDKEMWNERLPDGTRVGTRQSPGQQPGVVQLRVDALRTNGLWMSVSAYNAASPASRKSGSAPLITAAELRAIAISRSWLVAR